MTKPQREPSIIDLIELLETKRVELVANFPEIDFDEEEEEIEEMKEDVKTEIERVNENFSYKVEQFRCTQAEYNNH